MDYLAKREPPAITKQVFPTNASDGTRFFKFHCKRVAHYIPINGEAVDGPWIMRSVSKIKCCVTTANVSTLNVHSHYIEYLISGDIFDCSNLWI